VRPFVPTGISFLAVDSSAIYILVPVPLSVFLAISFPSVSFGLFPYWLLKSVFCCQASSALTVLRAASMRFP
jgi:hypothetical protein